MHAEKSHHLRSQVAVMSPIRCSFCQNSNSAEAKYCNECGNTLGLKPCSRCDAVNDVQASQCHACGNAFAAHGSVAAPAAPSHPDAATARRPHARRPIVVASLVVIPCMVAFHADQQSAYTPPSYGASSAAVDDTFVPPARRIGTFTLAGAPADARVHGAAMANPAIASLRATRGVIAGMRPNAPTTAASETMPLEALGAALAAAPRHETEAATVDAASRDYPIESGDCTRGVAALGLCRLEEKVDER